MTTLARQAFIISSKDMKLFIRDRFGVAFALAFPLMFTVAFSIAFGGVGPDDDQLGLTIAVRDTDEIGGQIAEALTADETAGVVVRDFDQAQQALQSGELSGFVAFPPDYDEALASGRFPALQVHVAGDDISTQMALRGLAQGIAGQVRRVSFAVQAAIMAGGVEGFDPGQIQDLAQRPPLLRFERVEVAEIRDLNAASFTLPGYLTMFVFFAAAFSAEAIARERRSHTLERLLSNGTRKEALLFGKFLSATYRGLIQLAVLWGFGLFVFQVNVGVSPAAVIGVSVLMVLASAAFGVMLATFVNSVNTAASAAVLTSLTFAPLGGSWWPLFIAPDWQQALGRLVPHGWANTAFNDLMLFGAEAQDAIPEMLALVGFAVAFLTVAVFRFKTAPTN